MSAVLARVVAWTLRAPPRTVIALAWLLALVYAYPGYLTTDSVDQLEQARGRGLDDWHPPAMAALWWLVERVVRGPLGMLVLQLTVFTLGVHGLARRVLRPGPAAVLTALTVLYPPVLTTMAVIWKDSQMAGFLIAGFALALSAHRRHRALAIACFVVGAAMRHNAAAALLPLALVAARTALGPPRRRWWAVGLGATAAIALCAVLANRALTVRETHPWHHSIAVLDLVGTIREADPLTDAEVRALLVGVPLVIERDLQATMRRHPNRHTWWWFTHGDRRVMDPPETAAQRDAIAAAWVRTVRAHPVAWLRHRTIVWGVGLGVGTARLKSPVVRRFVEDDAQRASLQHDATPSSAQRALGAAFDWLATTPIFRPWLYLLLAIGLCVRGARRPETLALLISGLVYQAGLFVAAPSGDFRYSHWMIACTVLAAMITAAAKVPSFVDEQPPD